MNTRIVGGLAAAALAVAAWAASVTVAFAHPGHAGGLAAGVAHPLTGIDHLLAMLAVGLWASQLGRPAMWALPVLFPAVMAAGAWLGANGVTVPWAEVGIAASVAVLGAAIAFGWRATLAASAPLVGVFALFHGYAHGAELPASGSALLYGAGFVAATVALHLAGLGIGSLVTRPLALRVAGGAIAAAGAVLLVV